jgi:uncharacterized protein (DUF1015 family)
MSLIQPFAGLRADSKQAAEIIAPPYDVLNSAEARSRARNRPLSFLHVSKPEIDLPPDTDPYDDRVYAKARENFDDMRNRGLLRRDPQDCYYVYQLTMGAHIQTGVVAAASLAAYRANRIRKHEFTHPDKEDDRVRHMEALGAQTGPVFLTYRHRSEIDEVTASVVAAPPEVDVTADDGVRHNLWVVRDPELINRLTLAFDAMDYLYIADGHHRSAAADRVAQARRATNRRHTGNEAYNYFLAVMIPDRQTQILDYNRVVKDLGALSPRAFLDRVRERFRIEHVSQAVKPSKPGEFGMYLQGGWHRLSIKPEFMSRADPVRRLDVSIVHEHLLHFVLGIQDVRRDPRVEFVGGIRGLEELSRRVDEGAMAVAVSLYPTSLADLMAVADAGQVMPPKSTWFEPKLADGLISHLLD